MNRKIASSLLMGNKHTLYLYLQMKMQLKLSVLTYNCSNMVCLAGTTVPVRKTFPTVEYFFYGDTRSMKSSTRTTLLCYGSGIQRTAQYDSTLTTRTSVAMITWREMYVILSKAAVACVRATKRPNSTTLTTRSMFTRTSLLRACTYGLTLRFYAMMIKLCGT